MASNRQEARVGGVACVSLHVGRRGRGRCFLLGEGASGAKSSLAPYVTVAGGAAGS